MVYKQENALWRVMSGDKATKWRQLCIYKEPKYRNLDGEATECKLCKHCGCVNTVVAC